jgi:hypothetical protein
MGGLISLVHNYEFYLKHDFTDNADECRKQILALLRAGAEMRERVHLEWQHPTLGYRPMYIDDEITEHAEAWDAALDESSPSQSKD